ncbi:kinase-like domain-containing protein, partial [Mycena floridula]
NILVTAMHRACIADFGLSTIAASQFPIMSSSKSSNQGGTMPWQAPETIKYPDPTGNTHESDMYAFACVCCEVFTGKPPFCETDNLHELRIRNMVLAGERPKRPASSELTDALMVDCWKPNEQDRPTANEMVSRLSTMPGLSHLSYVEPAWKESTTHALRASLHENPLLPSLHRLRRLLPSALSSDRTDPLRLIRDGPSLSDTMPEDSGAGLSRKRRLDGSDDEIPRPAKHHRTRMRF